MFELVAFYVSCNHVNVLTFNTLITVLVSRVQLHEHDYMCLIWLVHLYFCVFVCKLFTVSQKRLP